MKSNKEKGAIKSRLRGAYFTSSISVSLVLFLLGIIGLLVLNAKMISDYVKENICFTLILKEDIKEPDIKKFQKTLDTYDYIKSTEYITKEKAAEIMKNDLGDDFVQTLGYNPLLPSIDVYLDAGYANPDSLVAIEKKFNSYTDYVKEVSYQKNLVHLISENVSKISLFLLVFSVLLMLVSFALINNTIRLMVYSKRFLIRTMQLVGATKGFIRKPFLLSGLYQGIASSMVAIILLTVMIYFSSSQLKEIINVEDYYKIIASLYLIVLSLGVIISVTSTYLAVNRYLKIKTSNLYY
ncbi:MAG TPA: permease-like cell division protein FtsX [Bacteroidales bacterium]|nr:permease-like cell division protein FtsX [Bacteroidales bacterium]HOE04272.1 permease-like cell division protein FtsX [Bacteroidales bacterium]HQL70114.1 permease-like cell division protein FtsX [Bacteroidales bacterium]